MGTNTRNVVAAPARTSHRYGLFSVLDFGVNTRGNQGLAWDSLGCSPMQITDDACFITGGGPTDKTGNIDCANNGGITAFTVMAFDDSSMGRDRAALGPERARDRLAIAEQAAVELKLMAEFASFLPTDVTPGGTSGPPATDSFADKTRACVGAVEEDIADSGGEGILFVPRAVVSLIPDAFIQTGSMLRTKIGTPVAACTFPAVASAIYGVPAMVALRSGIATGDGYELTIDDISAFAERDYSLGWDCGLAVATPSAIV